MYKFLEKNSTVIIVLVAIFALIYAKQVRREIEHFAFVRRAWRGVKRGAKKVGRTVKRGAKKVGGAVKRAVKKAVDKVKKAAMKVINAFKNVVKKITDSFKKLWKIIKSLPKKIKDFTGKILRNVGSAFGKMLWKGMVAIFTFIAKLTKNLVLLITKPIKKHIMFVSAAFLAFFTSMACAGYLYYEQMPKTEENVDNTQIPMDETMVTQQPIVMGNM